MHTYRCRLLFILSAWADADGLCVGVRPYPTYQLALITPKAIQHN